MCGKVTEKVPPKPQHCSPWPKGTISALPMEPSSERVASPLSVPREWQERWKAIFVGFSNEPSHFLMPSPLWMKSMTSQVRFASEVTFASGASSNWRRFPWKFIAAQEPDGTITGRSPAKTSAV